MRRFPERARWARSAPSDLVPAQPTSSEPAGDRGSAVVEFVVLGALLFVPVVYFVVTAGMLQGASYAAAGAADHAAKVFVRAPDSTAARASAEASVRVAMADFKVEDTAWTLNVSCDRPHCLEPGGAVTVSVAVDVPLPLSPDLGAGPLTAGRVSASATQIVGRFR